VTAPATESSQAQRGQELLASYLAHLVNERRLSAHSTAAYRRDIEALFAATKDAALDNLTLTHIRRAVAAFHARGLSGRSLARMLSAWRGFYRYLAENHGLKSNPCLGIRAPRSPKRLPDALTPDAAQRLVEAPGEGLFAVRDRAMLELFYSSGLRLSELVGVDWSAIDMTDGTVRVIGKGAKTRVVPVGRHALAALRVWRDTRRALPAADEGAVFVNRFGRRLSVRTIQLRIKAAGLKQGIAEDVHPHMLRHSFASHLLQSSGDLRAVQEMLGHASISSTQVYTHLDFQHLAKIYDAAHPRARRKSK
jgi:integrase/recombinase XerC